jgi:hypothetical protein
LHRREQKGRGREYFPVPQCEAHGGPAEGHNQVRLTPIEQGLQILDSRLVSLAWLKYWCRERHLAELDRQPAVFGQLGLEG